MRLFPAQPPPNRLQISARSCEVYPNTDVARGEAESDESWRSEDLQSKLRSLKRPGYKGVWRHYARSLECEHRLAEVIGQMVGAAHKDGEAIARSIFREVFFRYGRVPLEPVGPRHFLKPLPQFTVYGFPCLAN